MLISGRCMAVLRIGSCGGVGNVDGRRALNLLLRNRQPALLVGADGFGGSPAVSIGWVLSRSLPGGKGG